MFHPIPDPSCIDEPIHNEPVCRNAAIQFIVGKDGTVIIETDFLNLSTHSVEIQIPVP
jgi:hypothetical protein